MTWLIIVLVLVAAFGPVLWLMPSKRDKRLNGLRSRARQLGLTVDIKPLLQLNPSAADRVSAGGEQREATRLSACYSRALLKPLRCVTGWQMFSQPAGIATLRPTIEIAPGWVYDPRLDFPPALGWPLSLETILPNVANLPEGISAVVIQARSVGVFWSENASADADSVAVIASALEAMEQDLSALDSRLLAQESDENS